MADWRETANRGLGMLDGDAAEEAQRTKEMLLHVLDESNRDDYISKDFFNVQQTAGGLPDGVSFEQYLGAIEGHVRETLASSSFDPGTGDEDFRTALMSLDENIRRHIRFLNGVVHQGAPGDVHVQLWERILEARADDRSVYRCYRDYLVDA